MEMLSTGPLTDEQAEALLFALGVPLNWRYEVVEDGGERWSAQSVTHTFTVTGALTDADAYRGVEGEVLSWWLEISPLGWYGDGVQRSGWCFPCASVEGAKHLCQSFAWTGDSGDVDRLEACRYPLRWEISRSGRVTAYLRKNADTVAEYSVEARTQWGIRHFRADYGISLHYSDRAEHLETYLSTFHLHRPGASPENYATVDEAKAACERHHAAGVWPKGTLPRCLDKVRSGALSEGQR